MAIIIDGKALAAKWKENIKGQVAALKQRPGLAVILVGDDPASRVYVTSKEKDCSECGIYSEEFAVPAEFGQKALLNLIAELNQRPEIDGILCQLPLPKGYDYDEQEVLLAIDPKKDVDAFHPVNVGRLYQGRAIFQPCTPAGVIELIHSVGVEIAGKTCVVI
ncbi:MAG: bifunctional 5,10-methylene-tetrahydrofolate dehydrogenase/5,10-methylene-tetrahydrofolate cyclohydrolase, partial [Oscillospiraceae bacterium]|nr:bifunctional 5,10-methylene-tetrahydrofolate dehydrogenase/5,10-methylene-tetrahydrofolate cyclohydrolase [Oscillospiraceae bacterium]